MENISHSLVGATLAELALPKGAASPQRRLFFTAGIIAANLPDADLLYTRILAPPLGYLLHHRGHTHTIVGLLGQAVLFGLLALIPIIRRTIGTNPRRFGALVAGALASHVILDSWNSYGVHPFWPFDDRWIYGDAIFIAEPLLWALLGVSVVMNARRMPARWLVGAFLVAIVIAGTILGQISVMSLAGVAVVAAGCATLQLRQTPHARALTALVATAVFVGAMFDARDTVARQVVSQVPTDSGVTVVDVVLSPQPANPFCWSALLITRNDSAGDYTMTSGSVPLGNTSGCGRAQAGTTQWSEPVHQSLARLRQLAKDDCRARAWLQFGRAPVVSAGRMDDMRYTGATRDNFTTMQLDVPSNACPAFITPWAMPRADLLSS